LKISSGSEMFLQYAQKINLATGGKQSVPFGYDAKSFKSINATNKTQQLHEQTEQSAKVNKNKFESQTQTSSDPEKANKYNEKKGQNIDIFV
jgi:hypothetical protein